MNRDHGDGVDTGMEHVAPGADRVMESRNAAGSSAARRPRPRASSPAGQPSGPRSRTMGVTRTRVERSHQLADGKPCSLARAPFAVVTHAATAETRTTATASHPRFAQPNRVTGVK